MDSFNSSAPTDTSGQTTFTVDGTTEIRVREAMKPGYINFTGQPNGGSVSAEMWCDTDVAYYDNYDYIRNPERDHTYYCVAFNVQEEVPTGSITVCKYNDLNGNSTLETDEPAVTNPVWHFYMNNITYETGTDGCVTIPALAYGTYSITEETVTNWTLTGVSGNGSLGDGSASVEVGGDNANPIVYFLNHYTAPTDPTGTIRVCKYEDTDNNGEPDYPEYVQADSVLAKLWNAIKIKEVLATFQQILHPLSGWTMNIAGDNGHNASGVTENGDSNNYGCTDFTVPYGTYTITEASQAGWTQTGAGGMYGNFNYEEDDSITVIIGERGDEASVYFLNHYAPVYGCTDSSATNYNSGATNDDQSCTYAEQGGSGWIPRELTIYNEMAGNLSSNQITITWLTNNPATSRVIYDTVSHPDISGESAPNYGYQWSTELDETKVTGHSVVITGLDPNTTYYFRPMSSASPEIYGKQVEYVTGEAGSAPVENPEPISVSVLGEASEVTLTLVKTADHAKANPGDTVKYTLVVTNTGNAPAANVILSDMLPTGLSFVNSEDMTKEWNLGEIAAGEKKEISYSASVDKAAVAKVYTNTATVKADNAPQATATADLTVENVKVLAETGFSMSEFLILIMVISGLFGLARGLKFRAVKA